MLDIEPILRRLEVIPIAPAHGDDIRALVAEIERLRAAIATHRQEQGEAVTKSAADAADRRLWKILAAAAKEDDKHA